MADVVVLDLPPGPAFVDGLQRIWSDGDAAAPVDPTLPVDAKAAWLDAIAPTAVLDTDGRRSLDGGRRTEPGDALVVATSGSTGRPKGVVLTHDAVAASAEATSARLGVDPRDDHWLACLPLHHVGGLSVITRSLHTGTRLTVHDGFDAEAVMRAARGGVTRVSLVTRALRRVDTTAFRTILLGGAAPPPDRPTNAIATYGMTETGSGVVYERAALDGVEVRIVDGEVQLRCPMLLRCYRDGTDPKTADGWYPTGDLGSLDADGVLAVEGRRGEVIVSGGEKIWPSAVEPLLAALDSVAEVAIVGRPDPDWGHRVEAVVVPADPASPPSVEELRAAVRASLPHWAAPRSVRLAEALPRTSLGKIRRHLL